MYAADAHSFTQTCTWCTKVNWCCCMKNAAAERIRKLLHVLHYFVSRHFQRALKIKRVLSSLSLFLLFLGLAEYILQRHLSPRPLSSARAAEKAEFYSHDSARVWTSGVLMKDSSTSERVAAACQGVCRFPLDRRMHILSLLFLYAAQSHFPACCFLCFAPQWDPEYSNSRRRRLPACCYCRRCFCWMAHYEYDFLCFKTQ